jgi:hypothetical protein
VFTQLLLSQFRPLVQERVGQIGDLHQEQQFLAAEARRVAPLLAVLV